MTSQPPVIYLLHGDDEFAIKQFLGELEKKLGDPSVVAMNYTRLDGRSYDPEALLAAATAVPFLAKRRLVVLEHPLARLTTPTARQKFLALLERIPASTALVLVEYQPLSSDEGERSKSEPSKKKPHWLKEWAEKAGDRVLERAFRLPKGGAMPRWIQERARKYGGQFTPQAANLLASLVGDDPRLADQEIGKLLTYVDYRRPVDQEDVQLLTPDSAQGDIFAMVDALAIGDGRRALRMLHRLLEQQDPLAIFGMIIRQFRLLLLGRELLDGGGDVDEIARSLRLPRFVADRIMEQARRFQISSLENVYHHLSEIDEAIKTGKMPMDLALECFVADFTSQAGLSHLSS